MGYKVGIVGVAVGFLPDFLVATFTGWMTGPYTEQYFFVVDILHVLTDWTALFRAPSKRRSNFLNEQH